MLMARGRAKLEWAQTAELWAPLANQIRDPKSRPKPYTPGDINPFFVREEKGMRETHKRGTDEIKKPTKLKRLSNGRVGNRSGEGVPPRTD